MCLSDERRSRPSESHMKEVAARNVFFFHFSFFLAASTGCASLPVRCTGSAGHETNSLYDNKGKKVLGKKQTKKKDVAVSFTVFTKCPERSPSPDHHHPLCSTFAAAKGRLAGHETLPATDRD